MTEKYVTNIFIQQLFFISDDFFQVVFSIFLHFIYLLKFILDKKRIGVILKQKGKK